MTLLVGSIFHMTRKIVSEMTYNVSMGTLNPTIPYHTIHEAERPGLDPATCCCRSNALSTVPPRHTMHTYMLLNALLKHSVCGYVGSPWLPQPPLTHTRFAWIPRLTVWLELWTPMLSAATDIKHGLMLGEVVVDHFSGQILSNTINSALLL